MCVCARVCVCVHMHERTFEAVLADKNSMQSEFLPLGINDSFARINVKIISS